MNSERYIGLDVHQATISVAVLDATGKLVMESILETRAATVTRQSSETGVPRRNRGAHVARAGPRLSDHGQGSDQGNDAAEGGLSQLGGSLCGT